MKFIVALHRNQTGKPNLTRAVAFTTVTANSREDAARKAWAAKPGWQKRIGDRKQVKLHVNDPAKPILEGAVMLLEPVVINVKSRTELFA